MLDLKPEDEENLFRVLKEEGVADIWGETNAAGQRLLVITYQAAQVGIRKVLQAINEAGYAYERPSGEANPQVSVHEKERSTTARLFGTSVLLAAPLMAIMVYMILFPMSPLLMKQVVPNVTYVSLLQWVLATPVQFFVGKRFYKGAWASLSHGGANMDVLVALATSISYFYSALSVVYGYLHPNFTGESVLKRMHTL